MDQLTPQSLADALPDGLVVADGAERVTLVSGLAGRMLGLDPAEATGRPLDTVLALTDTEGRGWCGANRPFDGLRTRTGVPEQAWLLPDGTEVLAAARINRDRPGGAVASVVVTLRNGRGRARLDRERSDLVATVAHELRSPLTGVKGFVQAMLNRWERLTDEQKKLMLTTVHADSERLSRLIGELLDVARIDTGRLSLHPRPCDVAVLVGRVVDSVRAGTARTIHHEPTELPPILADPDKFTQVVTNLVENAVRHGGGEVVVATGPVLDREGRTRAVSLVVEDQGEGIAEEMRRRVFTKFWTGGQRGGSGLGLYLVQGLTRAHGGTVRIEDAAGGGARLVVEWPTS